MFGFKSKTPDPVTVAQEAKHLAESQNALLGRMSHMLREDAKKSWMPDQPSPIEEATLHWGSRKRQTNVPFAPRRRPN